MLVIMSVKTNPLSVKADYGPVHSCHHGNSLQRTDIAWTEMSTGGGGHFCTCVQKRLR